MTGVQKTVGYAYFEAKTLGFSQQGFSSEKIMHDVYQ